MTYYAPFVIDLLGFESKSGLRGSEPTFSPSLSQDPRQSQRKLFWFAKQTRAGSSRKARLRKQKGDALHLLFIYGAQNPHLRQSSQGLDVITAQIIQIREANLRGSAAERITGL